MPCPFTSGVTKQALFRKATAINHRKGKINATASKACNPQGWMCHQHGATKSGLNFNLQTSKSPGKRKDKVPKRNDTRKNAKKNKLPPPIFTVWRAVLQGHMSKAQLGFERILQGAEGDALWAQPRREEAFRGNVFLRPLLESWLLQAQLVGLKGRPCSWLSAHTLLQSAGCP